MLKDLQTRYPDATLHLAVEGPIPTGEMDEAQFWAIIDLLDWQQTTGGAVLQPAVEALSQFPYVAICRFYDLLNEKLYALDGRRFAEQLGSNAWPPTEGRHFSVDDFLYARCGVVANGRTFYEAVLSDPTLMPREFTFESLLYLPHRAWHRQTGAEDLDYFPPLSAETFSNGAGWPGVKGAGERIKMR